ncbi:MAG: hypothetical protein IJ899_03425 [Blautia sp.]|nr:hypothetical protein [Blautia sp.]
MPQKDGSATGQKPVDTIRQTRNLINRCSGSFLLPIRLLSGMVTDDVIRGFTYCLVPFVRSADCQLTR